MNDTPFTPAEKALNEAIDRVKRNRGQHANLKAAHADLSRQLHTAELHIETYSNPNRSGSASHSEIIGQALLAGKAAAGLLALDRALANNVAEQEADEQREASCRAQVLKESPNNTTDIEALPAYPL